VLPLGSSLLETLVRDVCPRCAARSASTLRPLHGVCLRTRRARASGIGAPPVERCHECEGVGRRRFIFISRLRGMSRKLLRKAASGPTAPALATLEGRPPRTAGFVMHKGQAFCVARDGGSDEQNHDFDIHSLNGRNVLRNSCHFSPDRVPPFLFLDCRDRMEPVRQGR
jgi:hypothetical protein